MNNGGATSLNSLRFRAIDLTMIRDDTDSSWEKIGRDNPYYGVSTADKFRGVLSAVVRNDFFRSGEDHVSWLDTCIIRYFGCISNREAALDFGCGVGRIAIPFSRTFGKIVGVDVSPSMLEEAKRNCERFGVRNVSFVPSDDSLSRVVGTFDLVHSVITFQHIPAFRGEKIIGRLITFVRPGGILALQFYFDRRASFMRKIGGVLRRQFVPLHWVLNAVQGRALREPLMQHNVYDLGRILRLLSANGIGEVHIQTTAIGGAFLFAQKPDRNPPHVAPP